jgi:hypothetical protein
MELGPSMDVHASTIHEGRIVNEDKVTLTLEVKVVATPGGDMRVTSCTWTKGSCRINHRLTTKGCSRIYNWTWWSDNDTVARVAEGRVIDD